VTHRTPTTATPGRAGVAARTDSSTEPTCACFSQDNSRVAATSDGTTRWSSNDARIDAWIDYSVAYRTTWRLNWVAYRTTWRLTPSTFNDAQ
jgi:hypothetical protein